MTTRLVQFTLMISINNRRREFNFRQRSDSLFDGNTADERGDRYYFTILKDADQWKFEDKPMPAWLKAIEPQIVSAFSEQQNSV